ncbi:hypothetical protein BK796_22130 [Kosakonia pseudosacchari]|uniref:DUF1472 domain-containing protein n=1 Tax=Kosakonia pseudosacchari TaxID=1646340 RepID=A0ABX4IKN9_9ENTR|nr:hypothetical protein BK796_22130 [Kosakonia pseudosacchari]
MTGTRGGCFLTTPVFFTATRAARCLSTGLCPPCAVALWKRTLLRAAVFPPAAGKGRKPRPCGLWPVP